MTVRLEFFGIPQLRAGVPQLDVPAGTLGSLLRQAASELPEFGTSCVQNDGSLKPGYLACIDGRKFTTDPRTEVADGAAVMILSADAGG